jgi:hypothetical protein
VIISTFESMRPLNELLERGPQPDDLITLRDWVQRYPYAGPLRMLLAKSADMAGDLERRDELLRAGAHVPSRRALFSFFMGPSLVEAAREIHQHVEASEEVSEQEVEGWVQLVWHGQSKASVPASDSASPMSSPPALSETKSLHSVHPTRGVDASDTTDVTEGQQARSEIVAHSTMAQDPGLREAMVSAIASVIERDVAAWTEEDGIEPTPSSERPDPLDSLNLVEPMAPVGGDLDHAQPQSIFSAWLQQRARDTGFGAPAQVERGADALIAAFIAKGDVKLGPVRDSLESTEEWAQQGLVEDPSLVTETMAKLYAQQGQLGRARKAYKLLALKYPEKSVYFAAQLKKLRNS